MKGDLELWREGAHVHILRAQQERAERDALRNARLALDVPYEPPLANPPELWDGNDTGYPLMRQRRSVAPIRVLVLYLFRLVWWRIRWRLWRWRLGVEP